MTPPSWWSEDRLAGLTDSFTSENWVEKDDLLKASLELVERFHWQSHTMSHLARDNLGETDCIMEDGGEEQYGRVGRGGAFRRTYVVKWARSVC